MNSKSNEIKELEEQNFLLQGKIKELEHTIKLYDDMLMEYKEIVYKLLEKQRKWV